MEVNNLFPGWEVVKLIGKGSFGSVYEIQRKLFDKTEKAAVKIISIPQSDLDIDTLYADGYSKKEITEYLEGQLKNIINEYSLMREISACPNVVRCDDVQYVQHSDDAGWDISIRMELLTPLLKALPDTIDDGFVVKLGKDLLNALSICKNKNILHRDIKPQNIFVSEDGIVKLGDFGIAKTIEKTSGGTRIGTYKFMAPEVYNNKPYGTGADLYSLGLVMYWLLNNRRMPFQDPKTSRLSIESEENARQRRLDGERLPAPLNGSEELKRIVLKACEFNVADRYDSPQSMLDALNALSKGTNANYPMAAFATPIVDGEDEDEKTIGVFSGPEIKPIGQPVMPQTAKESVSPQKKKKSPAKWITGTIAAVAAVFAVLIYTHVICINHSFTTATCTDASVCEYCGKKNSDAVGHNYSEANCTESAVCSRCGDMTSDALGHDWTEATCNQAKTCNRCGETDGSNLGHDYSEASCTEPAVCSRCGDTTSDALGHDWTEATCYQAKTCNRCGEIAGVPLDHIWQEASIFAPRTCIRCNTTRGSKFFINVGDTIRFGSYEQDNNLQNGKEPIEWIVLRENGSMRLVVSKYVLDTQPYHQLFENTSWKQCDLRLWLNETFLNNAFSEDEQANIMHNITSDYNIMSTDRVFLLSGIEVEEYLSTVESRRSTPTAYAKAQGVFTEDMYMTADGEAPCWWWLRSPSTRFPTFAEYVGVGGNVNSTGTDQRNSNGGVRPVLWIDLEA